MQPSVIDSTYIVRLVQGPIYTANGRLCVAGFCARLQPAWRGRSLHCLIRYSVLGSGENR